MNLYHPAGLCYNGHEADLKTLRLLLRIIDSDRYWAEGAKPTYIFKGTLQEFHIKKHLLAGYYLDLITLLKGLLHMINKGL